MLLLCYQEVHIMKEKETQAVIRNYKDTIFRKLFSDKENLLSLYNLMTNQNYTDPDSITIITLENAIYMNIKNDLAFLVNCTVCKSISLLCHPTCLYGICFMYRTNTRSLPIRLHCILPSK